MCRFKESTTSNTLFVRISFEWSSNNNFICPVQTFTLHLEAVNSYIPAKLHFLKGEFLFFYIVNCKQHSKMKRVYEQFLVINKK